MNYLSIFQYRVNERGVGFLWQNYYSKCLLFSIVPLNKIAMWKEEIVLSLKSLISLIQSLNKIFFYFGNVIRKESKRIFLCIYILYYEDHYFCY